MLNKIKLSTDWGLISVYSFSVYRVENFLIVPRTALSLQGSALWQIVALNVVHRFVAVQISGIKVLMLLFYQMVSF